jgi:hypothetical protein
MKGLIAALGMLITVGVLVAYTLVELVIKWAPLLVFAAGIWIAIKVWRSRRKRRESRAHIEAPWEWEYPAHRSASGLAVPQIAPSPSVSPVASAPAGAAPGPPGALPPVIAHQDRSFVVRGQDGGLLSDREDGYLYVSAQDLPRVPRVPAAHQHRPSVGARRASSRREVRRRP